MLALLLLALPFAFSKEVEVVLASSPRWVFPNGDPGRDMVPADAVGCAGGELLYFQGSLELAFNGSVALYGAVTFSGLLDMVVDGLQPEFFETNPTPSALIKCAYIGRWAFPDGGPHTLQISYLGGAGGRGYIVNATIYDNSTAVPPLPEQAPPDPPADTPSAAPSHRKDIRPSLVIAIILVCIAGLVLLAVLVCLAQLCRKRRQRALAMRAPSAAFRAGVRPATVPPPPPPPVPGWRREHSLRLAAKTSRRDAVRPRSATPVAGPSSQPSS